MITIKDYAKQKGVSYEAIRKQIKRYEDELEGHLVKQNRFLMLDDDAVRFLDSKRSENPVIVYEQNKDEELEQLRKENKVLLIQMNTVQDQLGKVQQKLIAEMNTTKLLTNEKVQYLEYKAQAEQKDLQLQDLAKARDAAQEKSDQQEALLRLKEQQIGALTAAKESASENLQAAQTKLEELEKRAKAAEEETNRLKNRSFWDWLFNR